MYHCGTIGWLFYWWQNTPSPLMCTQGGGDGSGVVGRGGWGLSQRGVGAVQKVDTALMQAASLSEEMEADTEYAR